MNTGLVQTGRWTESQRVMFAHLTCLCLGVNLLLWSLAPLFVERLLTNTAPSAGAVWAQSAAFTLSIVFVCLHLLIRARRRWAIWTAFTISTLMVASGIALVTIIGFLPSSSSVLAFAAVTCYASWRGLDTSPAR